MFARVVDSNGGGPPHHRVADHRPHVQRLGAVGRADRAQHLAHRGLNRQWPFRLHLSQGSGQEVGSWPLHNRRVMYCCHLLGVGRASATSLDPAARHDLVELAEEIPQRLGVVEDFFPATQRTSRV